MREVESMHERKALMAQLADAFIALPGGYGTLDELFEMVTWAQIGLHTRPIGLLEVEQFFEPLLAYLRHTAHEGFIPLQHLNLLLRADTPAALLDMLLAYQSQPLEEKWRDLPKP
jgi:uncharacterized protein (TIGR00730 family)